MLADFRAANFGRSLMALSDIYLNTCVTELAVLQEREETLPTQKHSPSHRDLFGGMDEGLEAFLYSTPFGAQ